MIVLWLADGDQVGDKVRVPLMVAGLIQPLIHVLVLAGKHDGKHLGRTGIGGSMKSAHEALEKDGQSSKQYPCYIRFAKSKCMIRQLYVNAAFCPVLRDACSFLITQRRGSSLNVLCSP